MANRRIRQLFRLLWAFIILNFATTGTAHDKTLDVVAKVKSKRWLHGQKDCSRDTEAAIDILKLTESSYILRQNKCIHYEAPFMYLLMGQHSVFLLDTGATSDPKQFPIRRVVKQLIASYENKHRVSQLELIIAHSHSHNDHYAGDNQFQGLTNTSVVKPESSSIKAFFEFKDWPNKISRIELGDRELLLMPIPGHQKDSIAIYDPETQLIFTGDSFYPGRLYIRDWSAFAQSIEKLVKLSHSLEVVGFLGAHIEMAKNGKDYPVATSYQPNEVDLFLSLNELADLNNVLKQQAGIPRNIQVGDVILYPIE